MEEEKIMKTIEAVEEFRNPYESDHEWKLRRDFLVANYGSLPDNRLICMSNCYINSEEYGCRYPLMVMGQINEMIEGLQRLPEQISKIKGVQLVKFIKSEDKQNENGTNKQSENCKDNVSTEDVGKSIEDRKKEEATKLLVEAKAAMNKRLKTKREALSFVPSSVEYKSTDEKLQTPTKQAFKTKFVEDCQPKPVAHTSVAVANCHSHMHTGLDTKLEASEAEEKERENSRALPINQELTNMMRTFATFFKQYRANHSSSSSVDVFHMTSTKSRLKLDVHFQNLSTKTVHKFRASVILEGVVLAEAEDSNKKGAKKAAFDIAQNKLTKNYLRIVKINPEKMELQSFESIEASETSDKELVAEVNVLNDQEDAASIATGEKQKSQGNKRRKKPNKRKASELQGDLTQFIIFEPTNTDQNINAVAILRRSADAAKAMLDYSFHEDSTGTRCRITLDGQVIVEYMGSSKTNAKTVASERALDRLRQICWTIKVKQAVDSDETGINREEVMGELQKQMEAIPDDNVGNRLLRKMGWTGGGVGAEGNKGKAEPVAVSMAAHTVIRREGLGLSSNQTMVDFKKKVKEVIENYAKSEKQEDLAFAPCFSKEERAFIHQQCTRLNLKSQSRGTGSERYLTVSRKRTSSELFDHLMQEGGSTSKYELVPPLYESDS